MPSYTACRNRTLTRPGSPFRPTRCSTAATSTCPCRIRTNGVSTTAATGCRGGSIGGEKRLMSWSTTLIDRLVSIDKIDWEVQVRKLGFVEIEVARLRNIATESRNVSPIQRRTEKRPSGRTTISSVPKAVRFQMRRAARIDDGCSEELPTSMKSDRCRPRNGAKFTRAEAFASLVLHHSPVQEFQLFSPWA